MRKIILIASLVFIVLSGLYWRTYFFDKSVEIKPPEWKNYTLDNISARRFVDLAYDSQNNPHIFYFAEMTKEGIKHIYSNNTIENYYDKDRIWHSEAHIFGASGRSDLPVCEEASRGET